MRILSVTAQRPDSTGSGVYLTELVRAFAANGHEQAVIAGVGEEDVPLLPEGVPAMRCITARKPCPIRSWGCPIRCPIRAHATGI